MFSIGLKWLRIYQHQRIKKKFSGLESDVSKRFVLTEIISYEFIYSHTLNIANYLLNSLFGKWVQYKQLKFRWKQYSALFPHFRYFLFNDWSIQVLDFKLYTIIYVFQFLCLNSTKNNRHYLIETKFSPTIVCVETRLDSLTKTKNNDNKQVSLG